MVSTRSFDYDRFGGGYAALRRPEPVIARAVLDALGDARTVVNVGAGAGSYEPSDRWVLAVEPSATMRAQRSADRPAIHGFAEDLPLDDDSLDAAMAVLTIHHWRDRERGVREMRRVARGPVVIVTFDMDAFAAFWLTDDYVPEALAEERRTFPPIDALRSWLGGDVEVRPVALPLTCADGFIEAYYGRPEAFLSDAVRAAQSVWARLEPGVEERFVSALSADLRSGAWDERHGHLRTQPSFESSMRIVVSSANCA